MFVTSDMRIRFCYKRAIHETFVSPNEFDSIVEENERREVRIGTVEKIDGTEFEGILFVFYPICYIARGIF